MIRVTALANFDRWATLAPDDYRAQKQRWYDAMLASAVRFVPDFRPHIVAHDMFTPTTIVHYTGHDGGAVYGRRKNGTMHVRRWKTCGCAAPTRVMSASSARSPAVSKWPTPSCAPFSPVAHDGKSTPPLVPVKNSRRGRRV